MAGDCSTLAKFCFRLKYGCFGVKDQFEISRDLQEAVNRGLIKQKYVTMRVQASFQCE